MFAGFNLEIKKHEFKEYFKGYRDYGEKYLNEKTIEFGKSIKKYIVDGIVDGTKIENDWFPEIKADVFISHSHKDKELAVGLAGWLKKVFNIECFIDSYVWGYIDDLLEIINERYSEKRKVSDEGYLYDYKKCNIASSHVNMMLSIALQKMIDKTEVTFLLNTNNSIDKYSETYDTSTYSPWIYSEIVCTQIIRHKELSCYRKEKIEIVNENFASIKKDLKISYEVLLDHLIELDEGILMEWKGIYGKAKSELFMHPLDELYKIKCPEEMEKLAKVNLMPENVN